MSKQVPKYCRQKMPNGNHRAFVRLGNRKIFLGPYGSVASKQAYARAISEWESNGGHLPVDPERITVAEVVSQFWRHAERYYVNPNGDTTNEIEMYRSCLPFITRLYGGTPASEFGPRRFRAARSAMVKAGWSRPYINKQAGRIKHVFKWAVSEELAPASVYHALMTVTGLKRGRTDAPEPEPILPVSDDVVEMTVTCMTPTCRAMVMLQRATGMRPGELVLMRTCDLDMSGKVWTYTPMRHKTQYRGHRRTVYLGPRAQQIVRPFLRRDTQAFMFQPAQSERERLEARHALRETPKSCGNGPGDNRVTKPKRQPGERYTTDTYAAAVRYACNRAFPAPEGVTKEELKAWRKEHNWSPNRLRHSFATSVRREHGLESAQVLLGHRHADVTQIYAERDVDRAIEVALRIG